MTYVTMNLQMSTKKLLLILLPLAAVLAGGILFFSAKNFLGEQAGCRCINLETATGEFEPGDNQAFFEGKQVLPFLTNLPEPSWEENRVLGETSGKEKWIEVDLSEQKLRAWEGDKLFLESLISSGKWAPTPKGKYRIWIKFHYAKMEGGEKGTNHYYYLPNVPYIMYFYKGFGLHGTYWHNNFGQPMSHGCVNLPTPVAEKLYYWTTPTVPEGKHQVLASSENQGTRVVIHE